MEFASTWPVSSFFTETSTRPLAVVPRDTRPSILVMMAAFLGLRTSKSSATRGRPPVMSLVFAVSRWILATMSPFFTSSFCSTMMMVSVQGMRAYHLRAVLYDDARVALGAAVLDDLALDDAGDLVALLVERDAFLDVEVLGLTVVLGDDGHGMRVPLGDEVAGAEGGLVGDVDARAVADLQVFRREFL